jgi:hypothetical protein
MKIVTFSQSNKRLKEFVPFFKRIIMLEINFRNYLVEFCDIQDRFAENVILETH